MGMPPTPRSTIPARTPSSHRRYSQASPEPEEICEYYIDDRRSISSTHAPDRRHCPPTQASQMEGTARGGRVGEREVIVRRELVYDSEDEDSNVGSGGISDEGMSPVPNNHGHNGDNGSRGEQQGGIANFGNSDRSHTLLSVKKSASLSRPREDEATFGERARSPKGKGINSTPLTRLVRSLQRLLLPVRGNKQASRPFIQFKNGQGKEDGEESRHHRISTKNEETRQRHHLKRFLFLGLVLSLITALLLFFLWPRRPQIRIMAVERDARVGAEGFNLLTLSGLVQVNASSRIQAQVTNDNWLPIIVRKANVTGWWRLAGGENIRKLLGSAVLTTPVRLARRRQQNVSFPFEASLWGDPVKDPIFTDYYKRCITVASRGEQEKQGAESGQDEGRLNVDYDIYVEVSYLGVRSRRHLTYNQSLPCPMGPDQVAEILRGTRVNLRELPPGVASALGRFGDSIQRALSITEKDRGKDSGGWFGKKLEARSGQKEDKHQHSNEDTGKDEQREEAPPHPNGNNRIKY